ADRVFAYCAYHLRDRNDAEDALQTTFMHALRALQRGVVPEIELAWLLSIARNVCLTRWNTNRRRGQVEVARDPHVLQEVAPGREREGEELFRLQEALEAMPERERRAILLREWQGLSYREIAADLGLSQSAVETLIFRARRVLANGLRGVPAPSKRRAALGLDFGSLLGALKSLLGGAAVKVAVGAAVLATTVSVGALELKAERPAGPSSPPAKTIAPPAPVVALPRAFDSLPPAASGQGQTQEDEVRSGSPDDAAPNSAAGADHSVGQSTSGLVGPTSPGAGLTGAATSVGAAVSSVVEQVAPSVLSAVQLPDAVQQQVEQALAPAVGLPPVTLP
ncbi:MAG TPA: sigma-70 family RNA polymerase sigma factor, partial [Thermoleophilaceae bacterium]|nr:sigma-70 family RNA polymerase sigma factor [Thermoleophilaceae bacterium]